MKPRAIKILLQAFTPCVQLVDMYTAGAFLHCNGLVVLAAVI